MKTKLLCSLLTFCAALGVQSASAAVNGLGTGLKTKFTAINTSLK